MKRCPKCGRTKSVDEFHKSSKNRDGLAGYCKVCAKDAAVESKRRHKGGRQDCGCPSCVRRILAEAGVKYCGRCETDKPLGEFHRNGDGYQSYCIECSKDPRGRRFYHRQGSYRLTEQRFYEMLSSQGARCGACGDEEISESTAIIDHDHNCCREAPTCGQCTRALVCRGCNSALGFIRDDANRALALATYLISFEDILGKEFV